MNAGAPGDWSAHIAALDNLMRSLDRNLLSFTLWNYCAQNTNARGDLWNGEDLSLWSRDQVPPHGAHPHDPYAGGRALPAAIRPYARKLCGVPLLQEFALATREFELVLEDYSEGSAAAAALMVGVPTEVFVPRYQYPAGVEVEVSSGHYEHDAALQVVRWWHGDRAAGVNREGSEGSEGIQGSAATADPSGGGKQPRVHRLLLKDPRNRPKGSPSEEWARHVGEREASGVRSAEFPGSGGPTRAASHVPVVTRSPHGHVVVTVPHGMQRDHFIDSLWARDAHSGKVLAASKLHPQDAAHGRPDADAARLTFALQPGGGTTHVTAFAACNLHGVWSSGPVPLLDEEDHSEL